MTSLWSNSIVLISLILLRIFFDFTKPDVDLFIKSIWDGSPFTTILEFSPILVKNILIYVSVAFWASSKIANEFLSVLPRIKARGAISISPISIRFWIFSKSRRSYSASYKGRK